MPSEKVLELKKQKVADLSAQLKNACAGVVVDYKGINVAMIQSFVRSCVRQAFIMLSLRIRCCILLCRMLAFRSLIMCFPAQPQLP